MQPSGLELGVDQRNNIPQVASASFASQDTADAENFPAKFIRGGQAITTVRRAWAATKCSNY